MVVNPKDTQEQARAVYDKLDSKTREVRYLGICIISFVSWSLQKYDDEAARLKAEKRLVKGKGAESAANVGLEAA